MWILGYEVELGRAELIAPYFLALQNSVNLIVFGCQTSSNSVCVCVCVCVYASVRVRDSNPVTIQPCTNKGWRQKG